MAIKWLTIIVIFVPVFVFAFWRLIKWLMASPEGGNGQERKRITEMVEDGKITAEEGGDLLEALGRANALRGQNKFSRHDIATLIGVAFVVLGFFLPWVRFNVANIPLPGPFGGMSVYQAGYQTGAIGWAIFIFAVLSAIPIFVTPKDFLYKISMLQIFLISLGTVLVISIIIRASGVRGAGLWICLLGFIISLIASSAKLKKLAT